MPASAAYLEATVEQPIFDGSNEIYFYSLPFWDGESGEFSTWSLQGSEQLPILCRFNVIAAFDDGDLAVLAPLTHLGIEGLCPGSYKSLGALTGLPLLGKFRCSDGPAVDPSIIETLKEKGMKVNIYRWPGN